MGVVLAVGAGVLGMHVLTVGHSAHGVGPQAGDPASHGRVDNTAGHAPVDVAAAGGLHHDSLRARDHVVAQAPSDSTGAMSATMASPVASWSARPTAAVGVHTVTDAAYVTAAAPLCDTGCGASMGSVCVAVFLLALLLRRRDWVMASWQQCQVGVAHLVRSAGVGPSPPSLVQLCVSRT